MRRPIVDRTPNGPERGSPLHAALSLPSGASFYRCALQVNPFAYLGRHNKPTQYTDEARYNAAIVQSCVDNDIKVIAVTDHYRISDSLELMTAARAGGIHVFPGFEAVTKDGVHFLCLFEPERDVAEIERIIGDCGILNHAKPSPLGKYDASELLQASRDHGSICIAAHITNDGGLLRDLKKQARVQAWTLPRLLACAIPGSIDDAPQDVRPILQNQNVDYRREHPVAVINACDVSSPEDFSKPGAWCWIKMADVSLEGLRQAFLDEESRIRLSSAKVPEAHSEIEAMAWQGGFLDGAAVHFSENLNVLIGGRGTGKSTVVESLRYALGLEPIGEAAKGMHEGVVRHVLKSGTKVAVLVRTHRGTMRRYRIERTVPNPPSVFDEHGAVLAVSPRDVIPRVEVYGQHEISELTGSPEKLTQLLQRFVDRDEATDRRKAEISHALGRSRDRVRALLEEARHVEERLAALPGLEETLRAFQESGLEEKLKERSLLVREERLFKTADERVAAVASAVDELGSAVPIDRSFLSEKALDPLPGKDSLARADAALVRLDADTQACVATMGQALQLARSALSDARTGWDARRKSVLAAYDRLLRELQRSKVDGEEFIRLRQQIEELRPLRERQKALARDLAEEEKQRRQLLVEWEDAKAAEYRALEKAAKKVNRALARRVKVDVKAAGSRKMLGDLLREHVGGRLADAIAILEERPDLSLPELAESVRQGKDSLVEKYRLPAAQADRISLAVPSVAMLLEELDLPSTLTVQLNVASESDPPTWRSLRELSTGQKATAVLLLLLLESDAPLIVDQPEDDLDNRFITDGIVPKMRDEKQRRQFIFATHNANIPVLGDAELIIGLAASGEALDGNARLNPEHMGSIDSGPVRVLVEELLEGGKDAFKKRQRKYGF